MNSPTDDAADAPDAPDDDFSVEATDGALHIRGDVDALSAPQLASALEAHEGDIELDMSETDFIDSSGVRVLIEHHQRRVADGHSFRILRPSRPVLRILQLSSLDTFFEIR